MGVAATSSDSTMLDLKYGYQCWCPPLRSHWIQCKLRFSWSSEDFSNPLNCHIFCHCSAVDISWNWVIIWSPGGCIHQSLAASKKPWEHCAIRCWEEAGSIKRIQATHPYPRDDLYQDLSRLSSISETWWTTFVPSQVHKRFGIFKMAGQVCRCMQDRSSSSFRCLLASQQTGDFLCNFPNHWFVLSNYCIYKMMTLWCI